MRLMRPTPTVASPCVLPLRPRRSPLRPLARLCSSGRRAAIEAPTAGGANTRGGGCIDRGGRGGAGRSSRILPGRRLNHHGTVKLPLGGGELLGAQDGLDQILEALVARHLKIVQI